MRRVGMPWFLVPFWKVYRFLKTRIALLVGILLSLVCAVLLIVTALLQSEPFTRQVLLHALPAVNDALPGDIMIGAFRGALGTRFELDHVKVLDEEGDAFITAERVAIEWEFWDLLVGKVSVADVEITRPVVRLKQREGGGLNVVAAFVKPGPKKPPEGKGSKPLSISIELGAAHIEGGLFTFEKADGAAIVDVRGIDLDAMYSLRGFEHDASLRRLGAELAVPLGIPRVEITGGARMDSYDLDLDNLLLRWKDDAIRLQGSLGQVGNLRPDLNLAIERFDLADVQEFAASAPLHGVVSGTLNLTGRLRDLRAAGLLAVEGGGGLEVVDLGVRLEEPLGHVAEMRLDAFDLADVLTVEGLPPALTGRLRWEGTGTTLPTLSGEATVALEPIDYQKLRIGPTELTARIKDSVVTVDPSRIGLAGGTTTLAGDVDLARRCFDLDVGGGLGSLVALRERTGAPFTSGSATMSVTSAGCWGTETSVVALHSKGRLGLRGLGLRPADLRVASATIDFALDVDVARGGGIPDVRGPVSVKLVDLVVAKQTVSNTQLDAVLSGRKVGLTVEATSGPDLGLELITAIDWGSLPAVAIHSELLKVRYQTLRLATMQPFDVRLNKGAVEVSGLVATEENGGRLIVSGTLLPNGATDALLRVLDFDLAVTDAVLAEGTLRGHLDDLTVKLSGTVRKPTVSVRTRLREFETAGRGPLDVHLDLALKDHVLSGLAALPGLLEVEAGSIPLHVPLDGGGGAPFWIPAATAWKGEVRLLDGGIGRLEPLLGQPLPPSYVGGKARGTVTLGGLTSAPELDGALFLRDLVVDLERLEARTGGEADEDRAGQSREVNVRLAFAVRDDVLVLRDTQVRTNAEGTVLELGATAGLPLAAWIMGTVGPAELRAEGLPPLLAGLAVEATLRRLPMTLVHLLAPAAAPVQGALEGKVTLGGDIAAPAVTANIHLLGGRVGDRGLKSAAVRATIAEGQLAGELEVVPAILPTEVPVETATRGRKKKAREDKAAAPAGATRSDGDAGAERKAAVGLVDDDEAARDRARELLAAAPDAARLVVRVQSPLPLALDGSRTTEEMFGQPGLQGQIESEAFPLPVLLAFVPGALDASGDIVLAGSITGSLLDPRPDVRLSLDGGRFLYAKTSVSYEDIDVDVALTPDAIEIRNVSLDTLPLIRNPLDLVFKPNVSRDSRVQGKRSLHLNGRIALDGWKPAEVSLRLVAHRFWGIYTSEIKAQAGAELTGSGRWPDLVLRGNLDVDDVNVELGQESIGHSVSDLSLPDSMYVHRTTSRSGPGEQRIEDQRAAQERLANPTFLQRLDADVMVRLGNKVHVKLAVGLAQGRDDALRALNLIGNIEPDVNLGGEVRVLLQGGKRRLIGGLEITRDSKLTALTKRFEVTQGSAVTMLGDLSDSQLEIDAEHLSRYGTIVVKVRGTLAEPQITFSSDEIPDQGDIMVVLLTGKPLSEQTAAEGGSAMRTISSALAGFGTKLLGKYTPLDKLDIDLGDGMGSGSVEAGKAVTPELFLVSRFKWGVRDERENRVEAELQFQPRILRRFSLEGSIGDRLAGNVQVVWRLLY